MKVHNGTFSWSVYGIVNQNQHKLLEHKSMYNLVDL